MEQEVFMLEEEQPVDPGHMLAYGGRGIFEEDDFSTSQLVVAVNALTLEEPAVPARNAETKEDLQFVPISDWSLEA